MATGTDIQDWIGDELSSSEVERLRKEIERVQTLAGREHGAAEARLSALAAASDLLSGSTFELQAVFDKLVRLGAEALGGTCSVDLIGDGGLMRTVASSQAPGLPQATNEPAPENDPNRGSSVANAPEQHHPWAQAQAQTDEELVVPLRSEDTLIGTLSIARSGPTASGLPSSHVQPFTAADRSLLEALAGRAGTAIRLAKLLAATEASRREFELLYNLADSVSRADGLAEVYDAALAGIANTLDADRASILTFDDAEVMRFRAWRGLSDTYRQAVDGHSPWRPDEVDPRPIFIDDVGTNEVMAPYLPIFAAERIAALAFVPLVFAHKLVGKFMIYYGERHRFDERERRLAATIAMHIATALGRAAADEERQRLLVLARSHAAEAESSAARMAAILEQMPAGVMLADAPSGRITFSNTRAAKIFCGKVPSPEEVSQYTQFTAWSKSGEKLGPEDIPLARAVRGELVTAEEIHFVRANGQKGVVSANAAPIRDRAGHIVAAVTAYYDISELKQQEAEREQVRERFIGILGHDLRNPLSPIVTASELLLRNPNLAENQRSAVTRILASAERMSRMIHQILDFAQSRLGGGIPIVRQQIRLSELLTQVIGDQELPRPDLRIELTQESVCVGNWDGDRLEQLFSNLIGNAIEHGDPAFPIDVRVFHGGHVAIVEVKNGGPPIDPALLANIFDPFRKGTDAKRPVSRNLGLGLFISQQIALAHGGSITVSSTAQDGTTFRVELPSTDGALQAEH